MRLASRSLVLLLMVSLFVCHSRAWGRQLDQPDAAKVYEGIWESVGDELWEAVTELRTASPSWYPDRASSKLLVANLHVVERLVDATRIPALPAPAEGEGWGQLSGDTRNQRRTAYLLSVDVTRLLAEENADAAAGRVAALVRFGGQMATEPRISSTAIAATCIELAAEQVERVVKAESLTESGRREMMNAVAGLDQSDPAGFKSGLTGACRLHAWIARTFKGSDAGEKLVEALPIPEERKRPLAEGMREERGRRGGWGRRNGGMWASRELVAELRQMEGEEIEGAAKEFERLYKTAMDLWNEPDGQDQLEMLDMRADRNGFGPLARLTPSSFSRQRRTADQVDEQMGKMRFLLIAR